LKKHREDSLLFSLFKIQKLLFTKMTTVLEDINIHPGQPPLLFMLYHNSGITQKELAKKLNVTPPTVAVMLHRMEKHGLIKKKRDENDRRIYRVYLADKGKKVIEKIEEIVEEIEKISFNGFNEDERKQLKEFFNRIADNIRSSIKGGKKKC